ncbi:MAG: hypothetical protein K0B15_05430 [Lentimicrobium sp.]|nr:hypothetical protein [Lentimicrobium sp.]
MSCHKSGGTGEGWFTVAGSVYDSTYASGFPNATVRLYTGPNGTGTLKATIQVDNYGNFYTPKTLILGPAFIHQSRGTQLQNT